MRKTGPASPKGSGAAGKARNPKKRAFSLPYISYNLHYTKYYKNQKQRPPSPAFRHRIYYQGEVKQLVESTHTEVRDERSFTLLEDVNCPAVLAEQCFVTSEEDVAQFGSEEGCKTVARVYYEAICAYFGTQPLDTPL